MSEAQKVRASNDQAMEVVNIIQEEMALVVSLIVQDEDDRNSLALVGVQTRSNEMDVRPETRARKKYIDIDPQCLSCSSAPADVKKTFKVACLSYNPTPVKFKGNLYSNFKQSLDYKFERQTAIGILRNLTEETMKLNADVFD